MMKNTLPQVGDQITVAVRNHTQHMLTWYPATTTYQGRIVATPAWVEQGYFCMTGTDRHAMRVIKWADVATITKGGVEVVVPVVKTAPQPAIKTYEIAGSRGNTYTVTNRNGAWSCSCPAGNFGKDCKHVKAAKLQAA